jgi:hypothetical protein
MIPPRVPNLAQTRPASPGSPEKALSGFAARSRPLIVEARVDPAQYEAQF